MQEHQVTLESGNLIRVVLYAEDSPEKAERLVSRVLGIFVEHPDETFKVIVNLERASQSAEPATLKAYKPALEHPQVRKIAFVGVIDEVQKVFADFAVRFAKKDTVQFFNTLPEASAWLTE
ncbi:MAG: hypothetical protein WC817_01780 [Patescibacteria group bacterium]|jgi:hypothetical protein